MEAFDFEKYRGKFKCGDDVLYIDWRLRKGNAYEISGKLAISNADFYPSLILLLVYRKREGVMLSGHRFLGQFRDGEFESYNLSAEENNEFKGEVKIIRIIFSVNF